MPFEKNSINIHIVENKLCSILFSLNVISVILNKDIGKAVHELGHLSVRRGRMA